MREKNNSLKQVLACFLLFGFTVMCLFSAFYFVVSPKKVQAVGGGVVSDPGAMGQRQAHKVSEDVQEKTKEVKESIAKKLFDGMVLTTAQLIKMTAVKLSENAADALLTRMATGGWGESASFFTETFEVMDRNTKNYLVGTFFDNIHEVFGVDICNPSANIAKIGIMIGLGDVYTDGYGYDMPQPNCTLDKFEKNWEQFIDQVEAKYKALASEDFHGKESLALFQEVFEVGFSPEHTDIGGYIHIGDRLAVEQAKKQDYENLQRQENQGTKGVLSLSGKFIETPAFLTRHHSQKQLQKSLDGGASEVEVAGDVMTDIPYAVAGTFLQTFVSKAFSDWLIDKIFEKGVVESTDYDPVNKLATSKENLRQEIESNRISYSYSSLEMNLLADFTLCPQTPSARQINNCVIDSDFANAILESGQKRPLTVEQAIDKGYIDPSSRLIGQKESEQLGKDCFQKGYCYANLVKLRKARILPIGWELAAKAVMPGETVSLGEAIADFNKCGQDGGEVSRFCHLIDPNWVLKYPKTQCMAMVSGPTLVSAGSAERAEYCADMQTCLQENEDGSCEAYGYCAAEKNVFRLGGTECEGAYSSCQNFTDTDGHEVNYLLNTVNSAGCTEESAGCKWYSTWREPNDDYNWDEEKTFEKIYLTEKIIEKECQPDQAGCTEFIRLKPGLGTNLVKNPGFEDIKGTMAQVTGGQLVQVPGWYDTADLTSSDLSLTTDSYDGDYALDLSGSQNDAYSQKIPVVRQIQKTRYYKVSAMVKRNSAGGLNFEIGTGNEDFIDIETLQATDLNFLTFGQWNQVDFLYKVHGRDFPVVGVVGTFYELNLKIAVNEDDSRFLVDNVMIEELDEPTLQAGHAYAEYASNNEIYLKKAPEYLGCYNLSEKYCGGEPTFNNDGLVNNKCQSNDDCSNGVVCQDMVLRDSYNGHPAPDSNIYTEDDADSTDNGHPAPDSNIYTEDDADSTDTLRGCDQYAQMCKADEVGCEAYALTNGAGTTNGIVSAMDYCPQQCVGYETYIQSASYFEDSVFPLFFIPDTGEECEASMAGCDEFTNLDVLAEGGEAKEYYTELRHCVKIPENENQCQAYYTWEGDEVTGYTLQVHNLKSGSNGPQIVNANQNNDLCNKEIFEEKTNPDCRQVYDEAGNVYYKLFSKVIFCSENCHPYRRTLQYENQDECDERQGEWINNECVFMAIPGQGRSCNAASAGCREYRGNQAGIEEIIAEYTFSKYDISENLLSGLLTSVGSVPLIESETGYYMSLGSDGRMFTNPRDIYLASGEEYVMSFWAKGKNADPGSLTARLYTLSNNTEIEDIYSIVNNNNNNKSDISSSVFNSEWQHYTFSFTAPSEDNKIYSVGIDADAELAVDNFKLTRVQDTEYLIKDSWNTPEICDYPLNVDTDNPENLVPQAQLGCAEYQDSRGSIYYLKSFTGLCSAGSVGCEAVIDTYNNDYAFEKIFNKEFNFTCGSDSEVSLDDAAGGDDNFMMEILQQAMDMSSESDDEEVDEITIRFVGIQMFDFETDEGGQTLPGTSVLPEISATSGSDLSNITIECNGLREVYQALCEQAGGIWGKEKRCGGQAQGGLCLDDGDCPYDQDQDCQEFGEVERCISPSEVRVPEDRVMYLVIDDQVACADQAKGCTELGLPDLTVNENGDYVPREIEDDEGNVFENWATQHYIINPEIFETEQSPLCSQASAGCEKYVDNDGAEYYFKNPYDKVCEYREGNIGSEKVRAWFKKNSDNDEPCVTQQYYEDGVENLIQNDDIYNSFGDFDNPEDNPPDVYKGWYGVCPESANSCTAFVDPTDHSTSEAGEAYYYLNNEQIDRSTCTGVSRKDGCVLFNDTSVDSLDYNAYETYLAAKEAGEPVAAVAEDSTVLADFKGGLGDEFLGGLLWDFIQMFTVLGEGSSDINDYSFLQQFVNGEQDIQTISTAINSMNCDSYNYCQEMADCMQQEKEVNECLNYILKTDIIPATPDMEIACGGTDIELALNNAICTADTLLKKNTNTTIKVVQDRECAQWYDCTGRQYIWKDGDYQEQCVEIGLCDEYDKSSGKSSVILENEFNSLLGTNRNIKENYANRDVGWFALDYSGYAIPDLAPLHYYNSTNIHEGSPKRCAGDINKDICNDENKDDVCEAYEECLTPVSYRLVNYSAIKCENAGQCNNDYSGEGQFCKNKNCRCLSGYCARPYDSDKPFSSSPKPGCRAYPDSEAPFPYDTINRKQQRGMYEFANYLQIDADSERSDEDLACFYKKVTYGNGAVIKYFPDSPEFQAYIPPGYCGNNQNETCNCGDSDNVTSDSAFCNSDVCSPSNADAEEDKGICYLRDNQETIYNGWQGYCLEQDLLTDKDGFSDRHPCLTWYPVYTLAGLFDANNMHYEAGYNPDPEEGAMFCVEAKGNVLPDPYYSPKEEMTRHAFRDYVARVAGIGSGTEMRMRDNSNYEGTKELAVAKTGSEPKNAYAEDFFKVEDMANGGPEISEDDILGVIIKPINSPGDMPGKNDHKTNWSNTNTEYLEEFDIAKGDIFPNGNSDHFIFIPKNIDDLDSKDWKDKHDVGNYMTASGSLEDYIFFDDYGNEIRDDSDLDEPYKDWTFYQVVWPGMRDATNLDNDEVVTNFDWGGGWSAAVSGEHFHPHPMFTGLGLYNGACYNVITDQGFSGPTENAGLDPCGDYSELTWFCHPDHPEWDCFFSPSKCDTDCGGIEISYKVGDDGNIVEFDKVFKCISGQCANLYCNVSNDNCPDDYKCAKLPDREITNNSNVDGVCINPKIYDAYMGQFDGYSGFSNEAHLFTQPTKIRSWCDIGPDDEAIDPGTKNYLGIRVVFDETKKYKGVWYSMCDDSNGSGNLDFEVYFVMNERCTELVKVFSGNSINSQNKAYTNEIYQLSRHEDKKVKTLSKGDKKYSIVYKSEKILGSAEGFQPEEDSDKMTIPLLIPDSFSSSFSNVEDVDKPPLHEYSPGGSAYVSLLGGNDYQYGGKPYGCSGKTSQCSVYDLNDNGNNEFINNEYKSLDKLFARIYTGWQWGNFEDPATEIKQYQYKEDKESYQFDDTQDENKAKAPIIAGLDEQNNALVNRITFSTNRGNQSNDDVIVYGGQYRATLLFYAWAHDDQMPISRILINWGDGSYYDSGDSKYRNHKPVCQSQEGETLGLCSNDSFMTAYDSSGEHGYACQKTDDCSAGKVCYLGKPITYVDNGINPYGVLADSEQCKSGYYDSVAEEWMSVNESGVEHGGVDYNGFCANIKCTSENNNCTNFGLICTSEVDGLEKKQDKDWCVSQDIIDHMSYGDRFGDTPRACTEGYFKYDHVYTCTGNEALCVGSSDADGCLATLDNGKQACRFRVGVQVKDNWGWCNADHDLNGTANAEDKYFDGGGEDEIEKADGSYMPDNCKQDRSEAYEWYDGYIYVYPAKR